MSRSGIRRRLSERQRHPLEGSLAFITLTAGLATFITGAIHSTHFVAVCLGFVNFIVAIYSQLISATTAERWLNILGLGATIVGFGLGLSHGGFTV